MKYLSKTIATVLVFTSIVSVFSTTITVPKQVFAEGINDKYTLLAPLPCVNGTTADQKTPGCDPQSGTVSEFTIDTYIKYIFRFAIAFAAFAAAVMFTYGGFEYMLGEGISDKGAGKKKMQDSVYGLLAVLGSYVILNTIDPRLVNIDTTIPPLKLKSYSPNSDLKSTVNALNMLGPQGQALLERMAANATTTALRNKQISDLYTQLEDATSTVNTELIEAQIARLTSLNNDNAAMDAFDTVNLISEQDISVIAVNADVSSEKFNTFTGPMNEGVKSLASYVDSLETRYSEAEKTLIETGHAELIAPLRVKKDYAVTTLRNKDDLLIYKEKYAESYKNASKSGKSGPELVKEWNELKLAQIKIITDRVNSRIAEIPDGNLRKEYREKYNNNRNEMIDEIKKYIPIYY